MVPNILCLQIQKPERAGRSPPSRHQCENDTSQTGAPSIAWIIVTRWRRWSHCFVTTSASFDDIARREFRFRSIFLSCHGRGGKHRFSPASAQSRLWAVAASPS